MENEEKCVPFACPLPTYKVAFKMVWEKTVKKITQIVGGHVVYALYGGLPHGSL